MCEVPACAKENLPHGPGLDPHSYFHRLYSAPAASLQHVRRIQESGLFEPKSEEDLDSFKQKPEANDLGMAFDPLI
jgi:hypothetical protein